MRSPFLAGGPGGVNEKRGVAKAGGRGIIVAMETDMSRAEPKLVGVAPPAADSSQRVYVWWAVGFAFLAALGLFCVVILGPYLRARFAMRPVSRHYHSANMHVTDEQIVEAISSMGGPEEAVKCLSRYINLPGALATDKEVAYYLLGYCGEPAAGVLVRSLGKADWHEREWAAEALGTARAGTLAAVTALATATTDPVKGVRRWAAYSLGRIGPRAKEAVPALIDMLGRRDPEEGRAAAYALGCIGPDAGAAVPALLQAYRDRNSRIAESALSALQWIGPAASPAAPVLIDEIDSAQKHGWLTHCIDEIDTLGSIGPAAKAAVPILRQTLKHEATNVRLASVRALRDIGPDASAAIPEVLEALRDDDGQVRAYAAGALGCFGKKDPRVRAALEAALVHQDVYMRIDAAGALLRIWPDHGESLATITRALKDPDSNIRDSAAANLDIGPNAAAAVPALIEALKDEDVWVRCRAAGALGSIGPGAKQAVAELERACSDKFGNVQEAAAEALRKIRNEGAGDAGK